MVAPTHASFLTADNTAPGNDYLTLTPNDSVLIPGRPRSFFVNVTGDVVLKSSNGNTETFTALPAGYILPVTAAYLMAATTATVKAIC